MLEKSITEYQGGNLKDSVQKESVQKDSASLGFMDWRDLFQDPLLQQYIERGLSHNTDYLQAMQRVEEASATLKAAKLAFLPAFAISPQAGVSSFDGAKASQTYSVPLNMSWEIDIFGRMRNAKEQSKALYAKSLDFKQAVRTQLIANLANIYYTLISLDQQLSLSVKTEEAWRETLTTARALMKAGRYNEAGVAQMEAALQSVHTGVLDLQNQIIQTENSMAVILGETPRHYARSKEFLATGDTFSKISIGVPLQLLSARPDVRQAERTIETAFYGVNQARSAFYQFGRHDDCESWQGVGFGYGFACSSGLYTRPERGAAQDSQGSAGRGEARLYADPAQCGQGGERCLGGLSDFGEEGGDDSFSNRVAREGVAEHHAPDGAWHEYLSRSAYGSPVAALSAASGVC